MGWLILLVLAVLVLGGLWLVARPGREMIPMLLAALFVAAAGYSWQGQPFLAGHSTPPHAAMQPGESLFARERGRWMERFGRDPEILDSADTFIRTGGADYAVGILRGAISRQPGRPMLWMGLGNALVAYADGTVTPPARFAFQRAAALSPKDPAPAYFLGLAYAQSGDLDMAERTWRALLASASPDAGWRPRVAEKLVVLARLRALMAVQATPQVAP